MNITELLNISKERTTYLNDRLSDVLSTLIVERLKHDEQEIPWHYLLNTMLTQTKSPQEAILVGYLVGTLRGRYEQRTSPWDRDIFRVLIDRNFKSFNFNLN